MSYHIKPDGTPGICRAKAGNCPYGSANEHFETLEDIQDFADAYNELEVNSNQIVNTEKEKDYYKEIGTAKLLGIKKHLDEQKKTKNITNNDSEKITKQIYEAHKQRNNIIEKRKETEKNIYNNISKIIEDNNGDTSKFKKDLRLSEYQYIVNIDNIVKNVHKDLPFEGIEDYPNLTKPLKRAVMKYDWAKTGFGTLGPKPTGELKEKITYSDVAWIYQLKNKLQDQKNVVEKTNAVLADLKVKNEANKDRIKKGISVEIEKAKKYNEKYFKEMKDIGEKIYNLNNENTKIQEEIKKIEKTEKEIQETINRRAEFEKALNKKITREHLLQKSERTKKASWGQQEDNIDHLSQYIKTDKDKNITNLYIIAKGVEPRKVTNIKNGNIYIEGETEHINISGTTNSNMNQEPNYTPYSLVTTHDTGSKKNPRFSYDGETTIYSWIYDTSD